MTGSIRLTEPLKGIAETLISKKIDALTAEGLRILEAGERLYPASTVEHFLASLTVLRDYIRWGTSIRGEEIRVLQNLSDSRPLPEGVSPVLAQRLSNSLSQAMSQRVMAR